MAIDMGWGDKKIQQNLVQRGIITIDQVNEYKVLCQNFSNEQVAFTAQRVLIIQMLVDIVSEPTMNEEDVQDCLDDFMETEFNVIDEDGDHMLIGKRMIKVRDELKFLKDKKEELQRKLMRDDRITNLQKEIKWFKSESVKLNQVLEL